MVDYFSLRIIGLKEALFMINVTFQETFTRVFKFNPFECELRVTRMGPFRSGPKCGTYRYQIGGYSAQSAF